ncbi:MAG: diguanylate cyclase domain-containing protein, partial [Anaerolineales bacterium]
NLAELSRSLLSSPEITQITHLVLEKAKFLTNSPYGLVGFIHPENGKFEINAFTQEVCANQESSELQVAHTTGLFHWVLENAKSAWSNDYEHDPRNATIPPSHQHIQRIAVAPALLDHKCIGLIAVANATTPYTIQQVEVLEQLADLYALGLSHYWINQKIQVESQRATQLAEITHAFVQGGLDAGKLIQVICRKVGELLQATCAVFLINSDQNAIAESAIYNLDAHLQRVIEKVISQTSPLEGNLLIQKVLETKEGIFYPEVKADDIPNFLTPNYRAVVELFGLHSLMLLPLMSNQDVMGVIVAVRHQSAQPFGLQDFNFFHEVTQRASMLLLNARLFQELQNQQDLLEKRIQERTEELQRERDFALLVMNTIGQGLSVTNAEGIFTYVNPAYARLIGYRPQEIIGKKPQDFTLEDDHALLELMWQKRLAGEATSYENILIHRNGSHIPVEINGTPHYQGETFLGSIAVITDLRPRKLLQERQNRLQTFRDILLTIAQTLIQSTDEKMDAILQRVLQQVGEFLGVDRAYIFLFDWQKQTMTNTHEWCAEGIQSEKDNLQDLPMDVLPQWMESLAKDPYILIPAVSDLPPSWNGVKEILEAQDIQSLLVMPIGTTQQTYGFVGFDSVRNRRLWQEDEIRILTILADHLASLFERRKAEQALRESQALYQLLAENISDVIFTLDLNSKFTFVSPSVVKLSGYTVEEIQNVHLRDLFEPESYETVQRFFVEEMSSERLSELRPERAVTHSVEVELRCKDGTTRWAEVRLNPLFAENGVIRGMIGSARDISERRQARQVLEYLATHDALTGLPNRTLFQDRLEHAIKRAGRDKTNLAVMLLDLDHFKRINDECGHLKGDEVLQGIAQRLLGSLRESDTVARMGGDEFTIILENLENPARVAQVAKKLLDAISQPFLVDEKWWEISASLGISLYPMDGEDVTTLFKAADIAMYRAKRHHNAYRFYSRKGQTHPLG